MRYFPSVTPFFVAFFLLCAFFVSGYLVLRNGIHVNRLGVEGVALEGVDLQWRGGLDINVDRVQIDDQEEAEWEKLSEPRLRRGFTLARFLGKIVSSLTIRSVQYGDYTVQIHSRDNEPLALTLNSKDLRLKATVNHENDKVRIKLEELFSSRFNTTAEGSFLLNTETLQGRGRIVANLAGCLPVQFSLSTDMKGISFQGKEHGAIKEIKPFVDLFGLDHALQQWITEYLSGSRYHLESVSGTFPWHNPAALLHSLAASIRVDNCSYTFAPGLAPIKTDFTNVRFANGVLTITPHDSTFHGQSGGTSWLDINFNDPEKILLVAYIQTKARVNKDILGLLEYYDIHLPFLQTDGKTEADLKLEINLNNEDVKLSGLLELGKSEIAYEGHRYRSQGGTIEIRGENIILREVDLALNNLFKADVGGSIRTNATWADLAIKLKHFDLHVKDTDLALDQPDDPLLITYHLRPENSTLSIASSRWILGNTKLQLDSITTPFNVQEFSGKLPPVPITVPSWGQFTVQGDFNGRKQQADMRVTLRKLQTSTLTLIGKPLQLEINYNRQLHINSPNQSNYRLAGRDLTLSPFELWYTGPRLRLAGGQVRYGGFVDTLISGDYDLERREGSFHLADLNLSSKGNYPLLRVDKEMELKLEMDPGGARFYLDQLGLSLNFGKEGRREYVLNDLSKLLPFSELLQRLKVSGGMVQMVREAPSSPLQFQGEVSSDYAFLVRGDQPHSDYTFNGAANEQGVDAVIDGDLHVLYDDTLTVNAEGLGFNVPDINRLLSEKPDAERTDQTEGMTVTLEAENGFLFFRKNNRILADTMTFTSKGDKRRLAIRHGEGELHMDMTGDNFTLRGQKLDDRFMSALFAAANFEGGSLSIVAEGTLDKFSAILHTDSILLKDYAMLNNILAVMNTVPALMTFSLPQYHRSGWPVDSTLFWFDYSNGIATVRSLQINSSEMDMLGVGTIDLFRQQLDLNVNLISRAGRNVSRIPVLGYILAGEETSPTLSFHVTGDLLDPNVEHTGFREIMTQPFEMIYRTMATPFRWAEDLIEHDWTDDSPAGDRPAESAE